MTPTGRAFLWINVAIVLATFLVFAALDGKRHVRQAPPRVETVKVRVVTPEQGRHPAMEKHE